MASFLADYKRQQQLKSKPGYDAYNSYLASQGIKNYDPNPINIFLPVGFSGRFFVDYDTGKIYRENTPARLDEGFTKMFSRKNDDLRGMNDLFKAVYRNDPKMADSLLDKRYEDNISFANAVREAYGRTYLGTVPTLQQGLLGNGNKMSPIWMRQVQQSQQNPATQQQLRRQQIDTFMQLGNEGMLIDRPQQAQNQQGGIAGLWKKQK